MKRALLIGVVVAALAAAAPGLADKKKSKARTLKDLEGRKVEVRTDEPVAASAQKAMENYRAFLDLESTDPKLRGAPNGHVVPVRELRLAAGAEFVVVICGAAATMPGLPRRPAAENIGVDAAGRITGLS